MRWGPCHAALLAVHCACRGCAGAAGLCPGVKHGVISPLLLDYSLHRDIRVLQEPGSARSAQPRLLSAPAARQEKFWEAASLTSSPLVFATIGEGISDGKNKLPSALHSTSTPREW